MFKNNFINLGLLLLRVGISAMMLTHGIPKINRLFDNPIEFGDPIGLGPTISLILALIGEVVAPITINYWIQNKTSCNSSILNNGGSCFNCSW